VPADNQVEFHPFPLQPRLRAAADLAGRLGMEDRASFYRDKSRALESTIREECWDERDGFFYSADVDVRTRPCDWFHVGLGVF